MPECLITLDMLDMGVPGGAKDTQPRLCCYQDCQGSYECWGYEGDTYSWIYPYICVYSHMGCWGLRDPSPRDAEGPGGPWRVLKVWELPKVLWVLGILVSLEIQSSWRSHGVPGILEVSVTLRSPRVT